MHSKTTMNKTHCSKTQNGQALTLCKLCGRMTMNKNRTQASAANENPLGESNNLSICFLLLNTPKGRFWIGKSERGALADPTQLFSAGSCVSSSFTRFLVPCRRANLLEPTWRDNYRSRG